MNMNVYVVLAGTYPVVFARDNDADDYAEYSGNGPVFVCTILNQEVAEEMKAAFLREKDA